MVSYRSTVTKPKCLVSLALFHPSFVPQMNPSNWSRLISNDSLYRHPKIYHIRLCNITSEGEMKLLPFHSKRRRGMSALSTLIAERTKLRKGGYGLDAMRMNYGEAKCSCVNEITRNPSLFEHYMRFAPSLSDVATIGTGCMEDTDTAQQ